MPVQTDNRALRMEAKRLMDGGALVPPVSFTLFYLALQLLLNLVSAAADSLLPQSGLQAGGVSLSLTSVFVLLLISVLSAGHTSYCLSVLRGKTMPYGSVFDALPFAGRVVGLYLLQGALLGLGLSFFVLPGLVLALTYSLAIFHLCDDPEAGVFAAMRRSRLEMRGRKGQLLLLLLSLWPLLLANAAVAAAEYGLLRFFPNTLAGNLLYTLTSGVLSGAVNLYLLPWARLSLAGFYQAVRSATPGAAADI